MLNKINKKASIGEAITWVVATIIVLVVLLIFIYASNFLGGWNKYTGATPGGKREVEVSSQLTTKTEIAFARAKELKIITLKEEKEIEKWIKGD